MSAAPPSVRPLRVSDPAWIEAAFAEIGWTKPAAQFERYLADQARDHRRSFVAEVDGALAGYATLAWHSTYVPFQRNGTPEIQDLNVLPQFQRRGIGTALIQEAERAANERSRTVGIGVGLGPDYGAAQSLYVRLGYVPDGRGVAQAGRTIALGEQVTVDHTLALYLTKRLDRPLTTR